MRQARLAKMDLVVDDAGDEVQARGVDHFVDAKLHGRIDLGDLRTFDDDRQAIGAVRKDDCRVLDERSHGETIGSTSAFQTTRRIDREYRSCVCGTSRQW